jgi:hypothetical protein
MISPRYALAICVLVAMALVPTLIHSYSTDVASDGLLTSAIPRTLVGYGSTATSRHETWGQRRFESTDWTERAYRAQGDEVVLTVVRSFDHKSLYHHPELAVAYSSGFAGLQTTRVPDRPEIPVMVLSPGAGSRARAMYVLHSAGRFIEDPVLFQIRTATELLVARRKPMTLFFVLDPSAPENQRLDTLPALRILFAAIDSFFQQNPTAQ